MPHVFLFDYSNQKHVSWCASATTKHPYVKDLDLSSAPHCNCTDIDDDPITISAPHPEIALMLLRCIQYKSHMKDTFELCKKHICHTKTSNAYDLLKKILSHEELNSHCLEVFKYELWCTQQLHPILRRIVPFIGPYTNTQDEIEHLYKQQGSEVIESHSTPTSFYCNKVCQLETVAGMHYKYPNQIPECYDEFAQASRTLFKKLRCLSPYWRTSFKKDDTRDQLNVLTTRIRVLLKEYNDVVDEYNNQTSTCDFRSFNEHLASVSRTA